ncbi:hypothetical protein [Oscillatoria salina]|uniref:hypothetical protein n=1 Tax=Oscillatoria salina TaxID=331517 RepID=UPI0013B99E8B|nr:hypothetical protein [Oscillatoria salina]MBZ8178721.1 hypothetical protein [Oscillatoria salina IIICB1]NET89355.1 hypothetical protein [Kamptonema sp. SIO1D9]
MNAIPSQGLNKVNWQTIVMFALGFWLSGSLLLDLAVVPSLSAAGMMNQAGFAAAGYTIFGIFNHIELLCAALVMTGALVLHGSHKLSSYREIVCLALAGVLLAIAIIYTYILTPQMSGLALQLNLFAPSTTMSGSMIPLHEAYWGLEVVKLIAGATLLRWCYRDTCAI